MKLTPRFKKAYDALVKAAKILWDRDKTSIKVITDN